MIVSAQTSPNNTVIVAGASGDLGFCICDHLLKLGVEVVALVRNASHPKIDQLLGLYDKALFHVFEFDALSPSSIADASDVVIKRFKSIRGFVNCMGIPFGSPALTCKNSDLNEVFRVNYFAAVELMQRFVRPMIKARFGRIVNISSIQSIISMPGNLAYGGSKAALDHATRVMANEVGMFGITCNTVNPTVIDSRMRGLMSERSLSELEMMSAQKRSIDVTEVASVVMYLLSEESQAVNGQNLKVNGSFLM